MTTVAVLQSNYIPWKGYFDIIHDVDLFVFYDDVQYTKNDWRNRNKIKTHGGTAWLTIPTGSVIRRLICEVELADGAWARKHWKSIVQYYSKAPHFSRYREFFEEVYLHGEWRNLSVFNQYLIKAIAGEFLGITADFADSRDYDIRGVKRDRLLELLTACGATRYVSGPAAKAYLDPAAFSAAGIELMYKSYDGYPEYDQFFPPFEHQVSALDLLFHTGPEAAFYIWGWRVEGNESRRGVPAG